MATWGDLNTMRGRRTSGGIYQRMVQPQVTQRRPVQQQQQIQWRPPEGDYDKSDVFEVMQRDDRKGSYQDIFDAGYEGAGSGNFYRAGDGGEMPEYLRNSLAKYGPMGLKATYYEAGQDPYDNTLGAGWRTESDLKQLQDAMPKGPSNLSFRDLRHLTSDDKNNVLDSKYVTFDPNYGWVTHRKNYDQNADSSWFMRNAKTIVPMLATMGLGFAGVPSMVTGAIGAGRGAVDVLGGKAPWESLLPSILGMAIGGSGLQNILGKLPTSLLRTGGNFAINQLINRGRRG